MRQKKIFSYGYAALQPQLIKMNVATFFDLASLTKPLATTLAILCLIKEKKISLNEPLYSLLEKSLPPDKKNITLKQLLAHSSGLPAHREYYKKLIDYPLHRRKNLIISWLLREKLFWSPGTKVLYSDLGFILLGRIVEIKGGDNLDIFVAKRIYKPLGLENGLFFRPACRNELEKKEFAATEDCAWRHKILCGEVHDDNCYAMGGVAGHAGLFGDIESVLRLTVFILDQWLGRASHPNYRNSDLQYFLKKRRDVEENTRTLGFDTPAKSCSSGGRFLSATSVGHLGYSGTSFWIDPVKELVIVLLTNRIHCSRNNEKIRKFRPVFHDAVIRAWMDCNSTF